jgi:hypothetical protein
VLNRDPLNIGKPRGVSILGTVLNQEAILQRLLEFDSAQRNQLNGQLVFSLVEENQSDTIVEPVAEKEVIDGAFLQAVVPLRSNNP